MPDPVIECRNLTHRYGERLIYENLSFEVPHGRILGLLGKNGTGKTTTINILNGYLEPVAGECLIFGENIRTMRPQTRARIALLLEGHVQYAFMTIREIERFYSQYYPRWDARAYYGLMELLAVAPGQRIARMSCGQRSQVALGLILAQNADLMILDDFSMGLDPGYRRLFVEYLRDYARSRGTTVFLTSHIIQDMEKLIDDCIVMDYGRILVQMPAGVPVATTAINGAKNAALIAVSILALSDGEAAARLDGDRRARRILFVRNGGRGGRPTPAGGHRLRYPAKRRAEPRRRLYRSHRQVLTTT